jgi:general secretion pathway protein A
VTSKALYHGLSTLPFRENTDPSFLWLGPPNRDAFTTLRTAVLEHAGVLLLTGDVGTGKTMLAGAIAESLRAEGVRVEKLLHSDLSAHEFRHGVAEAFGIPTRSNVRATFFEQFAEFLEAAHTRGEKMLLVIDEAQGFGTVLLDEIEEFMRVGRIAGEGTANVMSILLVSQTDIEADVIAVRSHLTPLEPKHVPDYIGFRLRVAGGDRELFSDDAIRAIAAMSGGVPRVISRVCDCALQIAADRNAAVVSAEIVREVPDALGFTTVANDAIVGVDERPRTRAAMKRNRLHRRRNCSGCGGRLRLSGIRLGRQCR